MTEACLDKYTIFVLLFVHAPGIYQASTLTIVIWDLPLSQGRAILIM